MAKPEQREKVRELRKQGWKLKDIAAELDISYNMVRHWCRDIELTEEQLRELKKRNPKLAAQQKGAQTIKENALRQRLRYQAAGREQAKDGNILYLIGCMLYWAEGAKDRTRFRFTNTDPIMLKVFVRFLREQMGLQDGTFSLQILSHTSNEHEWTRIRQYWIETLSLPHNCKIGFVHKVGTSSRKKRYPNGICAIDVYNTEVLQRIFGAIQAYAGFENRKWVE